MIGLIDIRVVIYLISDVLYNLKFISLISLHHVKSICSLELSDLFELYVFIIQLMN